MAAGLGFKTFTTGEVLSAANVNGYLMQGVLVFASAAARDAAITSPQEGQFAYLKDTNVTTYYTGSAWTNLVTTGMTNPMTTTGDTIYSSSGSTPARLGIGTANQVLRVNSGATAPEWATPSAGKIVQVVQGTKTTTSSTASGAISDTGLTVTITPTSASSTIMVFSSFDGETRNGVSSTQNFSPFYLYRASTQLQKIAFGSYNFSSVSSPRAYAPIAFSYMDSPATTSATTYKIRYATDGSNLCQINCAADSIGSIIAIEVGA